jgi:hypothetical protein
VSVTSVMEMPDILFPSGLEFSTLTQKSCIFLQTDFHILLKDTVAPCLAFHEQIQSQPLSKNSTVSEITGELQHLLKLFFFLRFLIRHQFSPNPPQGVVFGESVMTISFPLHSHCDDMVT